MTMYLQLMQIQEDRTYDTYENCKFKNYKVGNCKNADQERGYNFPESASLVFPILIFGLWGMTLNHMSYYYAGIHVRLNANGIHLISTVPHLLN